MTHDQINAELDYGKAVKTEVQKIRVARWIQRFGKVNQIACILAAPRITTRLSARIFEIEEETGVKFKRAKNANGAMDYIATPEQIKTIADYYKLNTNNS